MGLDATAPQPYKELAGLLEERGQLVEAERMLQQGVHKNPESVRAHENLGHFLSGQGRLDEAQAQFRKSI
jgi:Tfp pilus assembly protein PilF